MRRISWLAMSVVLALAVSGCGKSSGTADRSSAAGDNATAAAQSDGPTAAIREFLDALRAGNDEKAMAMLSTKAREKTASLNRTIKPPASDTAKFTIGKVDYVNDDGARVACTWTDLGENGKPVSDEIVWGLRREAAGWRVVGVAAQVFPGEAPLVLNFEDPEDMDRKQEWVRDEKRRRTEADHLQADKVEKHENPIRR
ncbi:MAG: hypothetical protein ABFC77_05400 [Thermoguttaceae bacterium]